MPVQHSPPAKDRRYQRHEAVLTPTARAPLDHTPSFNQLSANLDRGPPMEGASPPEKEKYIGQAEDEEGEESEETEVKPALAGAPEASEAESLAHSNQHLVSQAEQNFLNMMEQMTQFMG
ncbi:hypothetical protein O181_026497 [Austropuccinia psidii MF-1]|uniref:Uncharacterized protein n=1 Tax=Austropuccinia psidii MF-1 TaxID=1389203 RepID=A0A9Q3CQP7_9BASI|nr:hypothetical protein [Austropuccinia psidii MF-1]